MKKLYLILACSMPLVTGMHAMEEQDTEIENMKGTILLTKEAIQAKNKKLEAERILAAARKDIQYNITKQNELKEIKARKEARKKELAEELQANKAATKALHLSSKKKLDAHEKQYQVDFASTEKELAQENDFVKRQRKNLAATVAILGAALEEKEIPKEYQRTRWLW